MAQTLADILTAQIDVDGKGRAQEKPTITEQIAEQAPPDLQFSLLSPSDGARVNEILMGERTPSDDIRTAMVDHFGVPPEPPKRGRGRPAKGAAGAPSASEQAAEAAQAADLAVHAVLQKRVRHYKRHFPEKCSHLPEDGTNEQLKSMLDYCKVVVSETDEYEVLRNVLVFLSRFAEAYMFPTMAASGVAQFGWLAYMQGFGDAFDEESAKGPGSAFHSEIAELSADLVGKLDTSPYLRLFAKSGKFTWDYGREARQQAAKVYSEAREDAEEFKDL